MRIQNNVTAMNTHRMYTMNNDAVAASAKKLSSGYRINSAADDAAGLAISEKMRSQIRGLNMATKNSQDAISLVQTAEGALQETQNMLQRMNELAVQAATGTNEDLDRTALAKEFEQLKREINDVAEQTNFNNMKILDGSLSYNGYVRSAQTAGVNATVETNATVLDPSITVETTEQVGYTAGQKAEAQFDLSKTLTNYKDSGSTAGETNNHELQMVVDGKAYTFKDGSGNSIVTDKDTQKVGDIFDGWTTTVDIDGKSVTFTIDASTPATAKISADSEVDFDWSSVKLNIVSFDPNNRQGTEKVNNEAALTAGGKTQNGVSPTTKTTITEAQQTIKIDQSKLKDGDSITIGDKTYTFYAGEEKRNPSNGAVMNDDGTGLYGNGNALYVAKDAEGNTIESSLKADTGKNVTIVFDAKDSNSAAKLLEAALIGTGSATAATGGTALTAPSGLTADDSVALGVTRSGDSVTIKTTTTVGTAKAAATVNNAVETDYKESITTAEAINKALAVKVNSGGNKDSMRTTVEFDVAKMKDGDTFTIKAGGQKIEVTYNEGDTRQGFMDKVKAAADGVFGTVKGNALIVDDQKVDIKLDEKWADADYAKNTNALRIQVGALENEQLMISIDSMNTAGLKLDDVALTDLYGKFAGDDQDAAGDAITKTRAAINKISDQRATLGAMQNRLDHKIANLKTTAENLTASESRIRDVDMAQEMTNFTKNNILSQAATAMLAQANSLPQNVLSLLG